VKGFKNISFAIFHMTYCRMVKRLFLLIL